MSVCSGAFTLANTGLLEGLKATTTAGYIADLQSQHPTIKVVRDQRVVDNGKLITTAGLSAGIDGALHVIEVMDDHDFAQTVALGIEYDWRPKGGYARAAMADRMNPDPDLAAAGDLVDQRFNGDNDHWELRDWFKTRLSAADLLGVVKTAYAKGYAADGPWAARSVRIADAGPLATVWRFDDQQGRHWRGALTVEPVPGAAQKFLVRLTTDRIG